MTTHGGKRPGSGRPPRAGGSADRGLHVRLTEAERAELTDGLLPDETLSDLLRQGGLEIVRRRHKETTMTTTTHGYHIPPSNQGQTIEVGYLQVGDALLRRTEDRSTGRVTYAVANLEPDEVDAIEPWNTEPDLPADRWRTVPASDARDIEQGR